MRGKARGAFVSEGIIHREERLKRRGADCASRRAGVRIRAVEKREEGMFPQPLLHLIHRALPRVVEREELFVLREFPGVDRGKGMFAAGREIEIAADEEHRVANGFRIETAATGARKQRVVWVRRGVAIARKLPCVREQQQAVHRLHRPALFHKTRREKIQQLGMRRHLPACAEIIRRRHEPASEMLLPDSVRHHTGGEGICRIDDPLRQLQTPAGAGFARHGLCAEHLQETARHFLAETLRIAAHLQPRVLRLALTHGIRERAKRRFAQALLFLARVAGHLCGSLDVCLFLRRLRLLFRGSFRFVRRLFPGLDRGELLRACLLQLPDFRLRREWHEIHRAVFSLAAGMGKSRAAEDAVEREIIVAGDGVKLVIVTARAIDREAEKRVTHVVDRVVDGEMRLTFASGEMARHREVARRHDAPLPLGVRACWQ